MPDVSLDKFFSHLKATDLARKHLWICDIPVSDIKLYAVSSNWPGKTINPVEVPYLGFTYKIAGVQKFEESWKITVRDTPDFKIRKYMSKWMDSIYNPVTGQAVYTGDTAFKDLTLIALKPDLSEATKINMIGSFPINLGTVEYDFASPGEVITFDIEWAYQRWDIVGSQTTPTPSPV
jgi:hypothetical protein